ncbi:MAG: hypothetical protein K1060chlam5_00899, partial [Candidatus Anoxychlamydiales bacterium]|nr:hypothetical protein [Candidatus Anoxychlamydiales bacterium]
MTHTRPVYHREQPYHVPSRNTANNVIPTIALTAIFHAGCILLLPPPVNLITAAIIDGLGILSIIKIIYASNNNRARRREGPLSSSTERARVRNEERRWVFFRETPTYREEYTPERHSAPRHTISRGFGSLPERAVRAPDRRSTHTPERASASRPTVDRGLADSPERSARAPDRRST